METDVIGGLQNLEYGGVPLEQALKESGDEELSQIIEFIAAKLHDLGETKTVVSALSGSNPKAAFHEQLKSLLTELYCPYAALNGSPVQFLSWRNQRLLLVNFLVSECEAASMIAVSAAAPNPDESETATNLKSMLVTLGFGKPPEDVTTQQLFTKVASRLKESLSAAPPGYPGPPLLETELTEKQWWALQEVHQDLTRDYRLRREMLLKRVDVTIMSFTWSSRIESKLDQVSAAYQPLRSAMVAEPCVRVSDLLRARKDLSFFDKATSKATKTPLHRVVIGQVPDRGGRASEQSAPPPEMPSWQKRKPDSGGYRGRGAAGPNPSRGGGGRVQGGWNQGGGGWGNDQRPQRGGGRGGRGWK